MPQPGFFDVECRLESISRMGDPLQPLAAESPWELFWPLLAKEHEKERKSPVGRKPSDVVLMFKALILQTRYNLADEAVEHQIRDRLSFMRFLGLELHDGVPEGSTVWRFRERLQELELIKPLFDRFGDDLVQAGLEARSGQGVDATIVPVPIQRNRRIKAGELPEDWEPNKRRQKDSKARCTKKHGKSDFGYKNHIDVDAAHKLSGDFTTTAANLHDSQVLADLIDADNADAQVWADSAYCSAEAPQAGQASRATSARRRRATSRLVTSSTPPTEAVPRCARGEHVFGFQHTSLGGKLIRAIGTARAEVKIGCMNLTYNLMRHLQLTKLSNGAPAAA